jgi:Ca-activated chloride channel homolog
MHINAQLDVDVVSVVEQEDKVTLMLDLAAPQASVDTQRPPRAAIVVLDRSGSMSGRRLESAKQALIALIGRLADNDHFGLVAFDSEAQLVVAADTLSSLGRDSVRDAIASVHPGGSTDLSSGYLRGLQEARRIAAPGGTTILVLSDGHANTGIVDPDKFRHMAAGASAQTVTTSTIGIGLGYDDQILSELAIGGTGNHTFAEEADAAAAAVAGELDGLLSKTVQAGSLLIKPARTVVGITVLNDLPSQGLPEGVMVELGDFYSGEKRRLLITLEVPAMAGLGLAQAAHLELTYVSIPDLQAHTVTLPISVNVVPQDVARGRVPDAEVQREKLILDAQAAKRKSEEALRRGDIDGARRGLTATMVSLTEATSLTPALELDEEIDFLTQSLRDLDRRDAMYTGKRLSADRTKKSRGYRDRKQGGEWEST